MIQRRNSGIFTVDLEVAVVVGLPAPALHVGDDVFLGGGRATIERCDRRGADDAVGVEAEALLEGLHGLDQRVVVGDVDGGVGASGLRNIGLGDIEALAQQGDALVLHAGLQELAVGDGDAASITVSS